jgi:hypothetical protein
MADVLALGLLILPTPGMAAVRQMHRAYGKGLLGTVLLAWRWLARPYRDFVLGQRVIMHREDPFEWKIVERNVVGINALRAANASYIIASAHFLREGYFSVLDPRVTPGRAIQAGVVLPERIRTLYDLRFFIQYGTLVKAVIDTLKGDCFWVGRDRQPSKAMLTHLRDQGNVVIIYADAHWQRTGGGVYFRPFAGLKDREFSTGAARIARIAKCPVISLVCLQEDDGTIVLQWGDPIWNTGDDVGVMNHLIDAFEVAVGERPDQYVFWIGGDRQWDARNRRWQEVKDMTHQSVSSSTAAARR